MICSMCEGAEGNPWIVLTVLEDEEPIGGLVCSTGCLIDYAAAVAGLELAEEDTNG